MFWTAASKEKAKVCSLLLILSYGITSFGDEEAPHAICILCGTILANNSMTPAKLQGHMEAKHSAFRDKDISFYERNLKIIIDLKVSC